VAGRWRLADPGPAASNDCNANLAPDSCDIANGTSGDCNANSIADDCETNLGGSIAASPSPRLPATAKRSPSPSALPAPGRCSISGRRDGVDIAGATASSFTIAAPTPADAGLYDVVISSNCTSPQYPAVTTVPRAAGGGPRRDRHPAPRSVWTVGETITFSVVADASQR